MSKNSHHSRLLLDIWQEIVILDFNHLYAMDGHHKELADLITETLGDKVANGNEVKPNSPVSDYWSKGYQAVVLYHKQEIIADYQGLLWSPRYIYSQWPEAGEAAELHAKFQENLAKVEAHAGRFFVLQGILTPDADLIKEEILDSGGVSIEGIARDCNCKVVDWIDQDVVAADKPLNICIVDFVENCGLLPCVVNSNRKTNN